MNLPPWLVLGFASLAACGAGAGEFRSQRGFSLTYPEGWSVATKEPQGDDADQARPDTIDAPGYDLDKLTVVLLNPAPMHALESVNVVVDRGRTLINEAACADQRRQIAEGLGPEGAKATHVESCLIQVRGRDAISGHWDIQFPGPRPLLRQWQVVLSSRRQTYYITCSAPVAEFGRLEPVFTQIVNSVQLEPDQGSFWDGLPPIARSAIIGAAIGAVVGGIITFARRLRRKPTPAGH